MPSRIVHHADGVEWLRRAEWPPTSAIVTSLPDTSELPELGFAGWERWFQDTAELACRSVADEAVAIFYQTDVKHEGRWIDKAHLIHRGADAAGAACLWHKIVCRAPAGATTFGRPAYAHLQCFSRGLRIEPAAASPDVIPELGLMPWARAMGTRACEIAARFVIEQTRCRLIVDPFCGHGTMLAVANALGLDAVGVERSRKRVRKAQSLDLGAIDGAQA